MMSTDEKPSLLGKSLQGAEGERLGTIDGVYTDEAADQVTFLAVRTGRIRGKTCFVPVDEAEMQGDDLVVPYDKALVEQAPEFDRVGHLSPEQEEQLYAHYGLEILDDVPGAATEDGSGTDHELHGEGVMTRAEERLQVGTQRVASGRVRLRKHVVTEMETVQVPVTKERLIIEREPIVDADAEPGGVEPIAEDEQEIVLMEERVAVAKEVVPVERIRVRKQAVVDEVTVSEQVRKEQIDTETDDLRR